MAGNFYYKQSNVTADDIYTNSRLRDNAFVTVTAADGFRLPVTATTMDSTYNPEGSGRAAPVLKDVKISLEGEAASLRRADVSFTCFDMESFNNAERALLLPGSEVTIKYGYVGPERPSQSAEYVFRVYDYSFNITKENYFECKFKAVAKGTGAEFDVINISGTDKFAELGAEFITDYDGIDERAPVQNIFDYIDYQVQVATKTDTESADAKYGSSKFNVANGTCGKLSSGGHFGVLVTPNDYNPPGQIDAGFLYNARIVYITLEAIVSIVNEFVLADNENNYQIKFDPAYSAIDVQFPAGRIWSPTPGNILFPYAKDTDENSYGDPSKVKKGKSQPFITCESFAQSDAYNEFRIDQNELEDTDNSSTSTGTPKGILLSRGVIREIQKSFDQAAINETPATEESEKSNGEIDLSSFFKKIFAVVRDNSGGDWDLALEVDERVNDGTIWIVNKKSPVKSTVTPLPIYPTSGQNGVRELKLSGAVPKDIQAQAFGGSPNVSPLRSAADIIAQNEERLQEAQASFDTALSKLQEELPKARTKLDTMSYSQDAVTSAKGLIKQLVETLPPDGLAERNKLLEPVPYPLSVNIAIDGTEGFTFGDTITSNYLPSRYRIETGARVVFTVTKYMHTIKGNDWQTDLSCVSRIVKDN